MNICNLAGYVRMRKFKLFGGISVEKHTHIYYYQASSTGKIFHFGIEKRSLHSCRTETGN